MQMIDDCIKPERLEAFKRSLSQKQLSPLGEIAGGGHLAGKTAAAALDERIRKQRDAQAEEEDRQRFEARRKVGA